jgi:transcription elongation factor Elf1
MMIEPYIINWHDNEERKKREENMKEEHFTVYDVIDRGYNCDNIMCLYCGSTEVTYNQGIGDAHCANCGAWQLEDDSV